MYLFLESVAECALCQAVVSTVDKLLDDPKVNENIEEVVSKVCKFLPASKQGKVRYYPILSMN